MLTQISQRGIRFLVTWVIGVLYFTCSLSIVSSFSFTHPSQYLTASSKQPTFKGDRNRFFGSETIFYNLQKTRSTRAKICVYQQCESKTKLCSTSSSTSQVTQNQNDTISSIAKEAITSSTKTGEIINEIPSLSSINTNPPSPDGYTTILTLLFAVAILSALDRVAMSVAILPMAQEYGLSETLKGQISSAFSAGYGLGVIPCGLLVGTFSPKIIMALGVGLWSIGTFLTPIAANGLSSDSIMILLGIRVVVGAAESIVLPTVQRFLANWVPSTQKSVAIATIFAGFQTGTILAYLLSPSVMEMDLVVEGGGWRQLFYVYGGIGLLWLGPWLYWAQDSPDTIKDAKDDDRLLKSAKDGEIDKECRITNTGIEDDASLVLEDCVSNGPQSPSSDSLALAKEEALNIVKSAPWKEIVTSRGVIAMTLAHAANNWGLYNNLSWTPTFYSEQYGLNIRDSAMLSLIPSIAGAIGGLSAGSIADYFIQNQWFGMTDKEGTFDTTNIRKVFQGISLLGPSVCLAILSTQMPESADTARLLLTFTVGLQSFNAAGYGAGTQEKAGEKWSGLLYSMTSLPGVLFGTFGVYLTGQILDYTENNWSYVFGLNAFVDILGALAFIALYNSKREFD